MDFVKVQGLNNDFIVIDGPYEPESSDVIRWCARRSGIGADGVLVIEAVDAGRMSMRLWNADGGEAEMSGNGLRCVARVGFERGWVAAPTFVVSTAVGDHEVTVKHDSVVAYVGAPNPFRTGTLSVGDHEVHPFAIGNPHAVLIVEDVDETPVTTIGPQIENDALFPNRTNVEFFETLESGGVKARIWERGVGETQASGTGATAVAYVAHTVCGIDIPIDVHLPGGTLSIMFDDAGAWIEGAAEIVYSGVLD